MNINYIYKGDMMDIIEDDWMDFIQLQALGFSKEDIALRMLGLTNRTTHEIMINLHNERTIEGIMSTINHESVHVVINDLEGIPMSNALDKILYIDGLDWKTKNLLMGQIM